MEQEKLVKPPRIALLMSNLLHGGIQQVVFKLAKNFRARGATVQILLLSNQGAVPENFPADIEIINFNLKSKLVLLPKLIAYIWKNRPQGIYSTHPHLNAIAILASRLANKKTRIVVSEHNNPSEAYRHRVASKHKLRTPILEKWLYPNADAIVATSEGVANDLAKLVDIPREDIEVIYNPVIDDEFIQKTKEDAAWPLPYEPGCKRLIAVGRLNDQKDFATLLRAFAIFREKSSYASQLLILGEGPQRKQLEDLTRELGLGHSALLFGYSPKVYAYMVQADVCVVTSRWEGFSLVVAEALACGLQVVATDCRSGPAEILENGKFGWLTPIGDPDAIAKAIAEAITKPIPKEILQKRAEFFSVDRAAEEYSKLLGL